MSMIAIYDDSRNFQPAVWEKGVVRIKKLLTKFGLPHQIITRSDINSETYELKQFSVILFPGGYAYPGYTKHILPAGKQKLRSFVENGGKYVGICAGAYFAGKNVTYLGKNVTKSGNYDLKLYSGDVFGPAYKSGSELKWKSTKILLKNDEIRMKYAAAPCFSVGENGTVIARYLDNTPAIVSEKCGKGEVLLFGPHPELNSDQKTKTLFINLLTGRGN